jgi:RNA polymerase sigma-70 factor (ECF subfamily)
MPSSSNRDSNYYSSDPDVLLMMDFQKGNKASFETLMHKYYGRVLNFVYRFIGRKDIAEDLTQEVFIKVYQNVTSYRPQAKFQTWVFTIARNVSLNELRKLNQTAFSLDETFENEEGEALRPQMEDHKTPSPDAGVLEDEKIALIQEAIQSLPENQRTAVLLRRYEDFSYEEIAKTMNCSVEAVKSLLSRAKENLKIKLLKLLRD